MSNKTVIIIGAGIAGLTAGCYLQMNGYETEIYEAHNVPGGLCTAWTRKGYPIEGCIHGLLGSAPSHPLYPMWSEIINMEEINFIHSDIKHVYDFPDGSQFIQYANLTKLEQYMKQIAPEDKDLIQEFIGAIRKLQAAEIPWEKPKEFFDLAGKLKLLKAAPLLFVLKKWLKLSSNEFSNRFKTPLLREVTKYFSSPVLFEMFVLSEMDLKRCGYPSIGSLEFARLFEQRYLALGGKLSYNKRVSRIIVKDAKAEGIVLEDGTSLEGDLIISAADGKTTLFNMLEGKYLTNDLAREYERADINTSKIQISLGLNRTFGSLAETIKIILEVPWAIGDGSENRSFDLLLYGKTRGLWAMDKTLLVVQLDTKNSQYWTDMKKDNRDKYRKEKELIASNLIDILEDRIGNIKDHIDMVDVATPATYIRYTGNWNGSVQGWANENIFKANPFRKELPGLTNFYMIGQWVEPGGGVPSVFKSGRDVAQIICKKHKRKFKTSKYSG